MNQGRRPSPNPVSRLCNNSTSANATHFEAILDAVQAPEYRAAYDAAVRYCGSDAFFVFPRAAGLSLCTRRPERVFPSICEQLRALNRKEADGIEGCANGSPIVWLEAQGTMRTFHNSWNDDQGQDLIEYTAFDAKGGLDRICCCDRCHECVPASGTVAAPGV